jgi:hypothetical protein
MNTHHIHSAAHLHRHDSSYLLFLGGVLPPLPFPNSSPSQLRSAISSPSRL